jgi:hypothetical protein
VPRQLVRQLPFTGSDFTGRSKEVERLLQWLTAETMPRLVNIYGIPGSGKSTLAVRVGHLMGSAYPDCQLYFNLRESQSQQPISPGDLLGGVLIALGTPAAEMPSTLYLRATAFRSAVAATQSIIIIDNASDASQVEPLLPGSSDSAVLITSWAPISELPGVHTIRLEPFGERDALDMLHAVTEREITEPDLSTVREIVRLVGGLPLALRVAGGLLKSRPAWSWRDLLNRLGEKRNFPSLDALESGTLSVRDTLSLGYRDLDDKTAQGYRLLGLAPAAAMSRELAYLLVSAGSAQADETLDQLMVRGLLQFETSSTVIMHDLVWLNARDLVNEIEDESVRDTATDKMIRWSLNQLDMQYLPKLRLGLSLLPPASEDRSPLALSQVFVDGGVVAEDSAGSAESLASVFIARQQRLLLVGPGGAGKTTLVNHLCDQAAVARAHDRGSPVPLILLIRDLRPEDASAGLEQVLIRLLRYRYEVDLHPAALQVALQLGLVFLVLDGLDELVDKPSRSDVFAAITDFCTRYCRVSVLITTRPYPMLRSDLPDFAIANVAPWTQGQISLYLANLAGASGNPRYKDDIGELVDWVSHHRSSGAIATPLGLQMVAANFYRTGYVPDDFNMLMAEIVDRAVFRREARRGTLFVDPEDLLRALQLVAFTMQSDVYNRTLITSRSLTELLRADELTWTNSQVSSSADFIAALTSRAIIFQEYGVAPDGEKLYGFTHTAFREHFAASYLVGCSPEEFVDIISRHLSDGSWEAVFVAALELSQRRREESFRNAVRDLAAKRAEPVLVDALRVWSGQGRDN